MRELEDYRDKWGLLAQKAPHRDGGDTAQREGMYFFAMWLYNKDKEHPNNFTHELKKQLEKLRLNENTYVRHPDPSMWYSDPDRFSRDQMTPVLASMGAYKTKEELWPVFKRWLFSFGFMYNTRRNGVWKKEVDHREKAPSYKAWDYSWKLPDWAPFFSTMFIRAFRTRLLYPLLVLLDIELVLGAILTHYGKEYDELNYLVRVVYATEIMPTPFGMLARRIYRNRPHLMRLRPGSNIWSKVDYITSSGPQSTIQYYCARYDFKDPPLDLLYKNWIENKL